MALNLEIPPSSTNKAYGGNGTHFYKIHCLWGWWNLPVSYYKLFRKLLSFFQILYLQQNSFLVRMLPYSIQEPTIKDCNIHTNGARFRDLQQTRHLVEIVPTLIK